MKFALAKVEQWNLGLSAGAVAASLALATPHFATSLAAGALLEALNLGALRRAASAFFSGRMSGTWIGGFGLRFLALAVGIYGTLQAGAHPVALLIGLSIAMPAALIDAWLNRPPVLDPATLPTFLEHDLLEHDLDGACDEEAREAALLAERDERLAVWGRLFPASPAPVSPTPASPASASPARWLALDRVEPQGPDRVNTDPTVRPGPDETTR